MNPTTKPKWQQELEAVQSTYKAPTTTMPSTGGASMVTPPNAPVKPTVAPIAPTIPTPVTTPPSAVSGATEAVAPAPTIPTPKKDINLQIPPAVPSDIIATAPTTGQVLGKTKSLASQFEEYLAQRQAERDKLVAAQAPTPEETQLRKQLTDLNAAAREAVFKAEQSGETQRFAGGEVARVSRQASIEQQNLVDQINLMVDSRKVQVDAIKSTMDFDKENFDALTNLSKLTRPDVLKTETNPQTGDVVAFVQDPQTGEITQQTLGNIGVNAKNQYSHQGTYQNDATGQTYFYGVKGDGTIDTIALPGSAGLKPSVSAIAGLSSAQQGAAFKLADDYESASKSYFTQRDAYNRVVASAADPSPAGDLALIFNYMKVLDPGSVVREGEFATAQSAGSVPERIYAQYNKVLEGTRLSPSQRKDFVDRAGKLFTSAEKQQETVNKTYSNRASQYGIPEDFVVRDTTSTSGQEKPTVTPEKTAIFDSVISQPAQGGYFSNLWNAITGQ